MAKDREPKDQDQNPSDAYEKAFGHNQRDALEKRSESEQRSNDREDNDTDVTDSTGPRRNDE